MVLLKPMKTTKSLLDTFSRVLGHFGGTVRHLSKVQVVTSGLKLWGDAEMLKAAVQCPLHAGSRITGSHMHTKPKQRHFL